MKLAIAAMMVLASAASAEDRYVAQDVEYAPYLPATAPCMAPMSWGGMGMVINTKYVDESCMARQEVRSAVEYCADAPEFCSRTLIMVGDVPLLMEYPKPDSSFFDVVKTSRVLK